MTRSVPAALRCAAALLCALSLIVLPVNVPSALAQAPRNGKELIAVLELDAVGASKVEASAITDRLREELLRTGRYTMVDRSQLEAVLNEQALQQTGCTTQECAVQVGQVLGVRKIVSGRVTKISEEQWLVSAQMIDVETTETMRAESLRHRGDFFAMMDVAIVELAAKLASTAGTVAKLPPAVPRAEPPPPVVAEPPQEPTPAEVAADEGGMPWWAWALIGLGVVAIAAAAGGGGGDSSAAPAPAPAAPAGCPSSSGCGTVNITW